MAESEEVTVLLRVLRLTSLEVLELVVDIDGQVVVVIHFEFTDIEERSHHGGVEGSTTGDALDGVERAVELSLFKHLFDDSLYNRGTRAVTHEFDVMDLLMHKA